MPSLFIFDYFLSYYFDILPLRYIFHATPLFRHCFRRRLALLHCRRYCHFDAFQPRHYAFFLACHGCHCHAFAIAIADAAAFAATLIMLSIFAIADIILIPADAITPLPPPDIFADFRRHSRCRRRCQLLMPLLRRRYACVMPIHYAIAPLFSLTSPLAAIDIAICRY
jgi:hypothetical protein